MERYGDRITGKLCYDRLVITGTPLVVCYAAGMTGYLKAKGIRIFDYPQFAMTLREQVRVAQLRGLPRPGLLSGTSPSRISARKMLWRACSRGAVTTPAWCTSSRPWKSAMPTSPGTTSRRTRPTSGRTAANACTIILTSRTPVSDWSTYVCPFGRRFACSSTATAIAGWPAS